MAVGKTCEFMGELAIRISQNRHTLHLMSARNVIQKPDGLRIQFVKVTLKQNDFSIRKPTPLGID